MSRQLDLTIDLYKENVVPVKLKQDDTTVLNFNITENGVVKDLTGCNFELRVKKPDNTLVTQTSNINLSNGIVSIQLIEDCLRVAGESKAELRILKDNIVISTYVFNVIIGSSLANITPSGNVATLVNQLNAAIGQGLVTKEQLDAWVGAHADIVNLDNRVQENTSQLADNTNQLSVLKSEKFLFIGDSYAQGYTPDGNVTSWCRYVKSMLGISDTDYYEYFHGGYGFTTSPGFRDLLNNAISGITDKENVKYVIIGGGYNDASSYANIATNIATFSNLCRTNFPNAVILLCPFGWCVEGLTTGVHTGQLISNLINMVLEYQKGAITNGLSYVEGIYSSLHKNDFFSSDFVHPNSSGQYNIALSLANYIKSRTFSTLQYMTSFDCFTSNVYENGITTSITCLATVDSNNTVLQLGTGHINGTFNDIKLDGHDILLGTIKSAVINGNNKTININCSGIIRTTSGTYLEVNLTIKISNNKLYMNIVKINSTNSDFDIVSFNRVSIYNPPNTITVNSLLN